jgi:hypothetical protein
MIKDCAWVLQHRRTRLLLPNISKPIARFSVSGFASYPLSILISELHSHWSSKANGKSTIKLDVFVSNGTNGGRPLVSRAPATSYPPTKREKPARASKSRGAMICLQDCGCWRDPVLVETAKVDASRADSGKRPRGQRKSGVTELLIHTGRMDTQHRRGSHRPHILSG